MHKIIWGEPSITCQIYANTHDMTEHIYMNSYHYREHNFMLIEEYMHPCTYRNIQKLLKIVNSSFIIKLYINNNQLGCSMMNTANTQCQCYCE